MGDRTSCLAKTGFGRPVPVGVTTVPLVREAEIELRRPHLHLIPLELRPADLAQSLT